MTGLRWPAPGFVFNYIPVLLGYEFDFQFHGNSTMKEAFSSSGVVIRGTGSIGIRHIRVFRDLLGMRTVAVPWRTDRASSLQKEGYATARSLSEAISGENLLLVVASDTDRHIEDAIAGITLGCKSVLIEKPLAAGVADVRSLQVLTSEGRAKVFVACNLRFDSALNLFRKMLPEIGDLHHVRIEAQSYLPEWRPERPYRESYSASSEQGGVLRDLIHDIDYAVWLFGKPAAVTCQLSNSGRLGIASEEAADLLWSTPSGATVSIRLDYLTRHYRRLMTAFGTGGQLTWDFPSHTVTLQKLDYEPVVTRAPQERDQMMREQANAFVDASAGGNGRQLATLQEGIFAVAICDAARISSCTGLTEPIHE
jgi:predicted dehydrogenase